jgi:hypothetical protein
MAENMVLYTAVYEDRPRIRAAPETFGGGTLPRKHLQEATDALASELQEALRSEK